jgi:hypothetical protein
LHEYRLNNSVRMLLAVLAACMAGASSVAAQMVSPTMSDATIVTRGATRLRSGVDWTRIDAVYGPNGSGILPLGSALSGELTSANLPLLLTGETAARTLANDGAITFNAGRLSTSANSRTVSVPISIEYGLTSRISLGILVPIVQSRSVVTSQLNGRADSIANVGTNPAFFHGSTAAYGANAAVVNALTAARDQLDQRVADCTTNPAASGCSTVIARQAEANALLQQSTDFAFAASTLYGVSDDDPGAPFVPLTGSALQAAIDARLASLRADFTSFGINGGSGAFAAAQAQAANAQLGEIVNDVDFGIELDSIGSTEQTTVGDIELSVSARLFNSLGATRGFRGRAAAMGILRLGTGHPARANRPFDVPTGDGQMDLEARGALDMFLGKRLLTTIAGTLTIQTGSVETTRLPYAPGSVLALDFPVSGSIKPGNMASVRINPRYLITPALMVGVLGVGSFRAADEVTVTGFAPDDILFGNRSSYSQIAGGFTLSYSNIASAEGIGGPGFPAEIVYSHLETLTASAAGAAKTFRDAIEVRYYFRTRR